MLDGIMATFWLVVLLGMTIFVHELGHYTAARMFGFVVEVFSIGFGPAIWKKRYKGIVYKIAWIPFGGYVALPQLDPSGMSKIQSTDGNEKGAVSLTTGKPLPPVAAWQKIVVSLAGSAGNMILAVGIAWLVYWIGIPASPAEQSATIGWVSEDSEAYQKGLRIGDEVLTVNGEEVKNWRDVRMAAGLEKEVTITAKALSGESKTVKLQTERGRMGGQLVPGLEGRDLCMVGKLREGSSVEGIGLQPHDIVIQFGGQDVVSRTHLSLLVQENGAKKAELIVKRFEGKKDVTLQKFLAEPKYDEKEKRFLLGIEWAPREISVEPDRFVWPTPREQLSFHATAIFRVLRALTTPKQAKMAQDAVGGPPAVFVGLWYVVNVSLMLAVWFTGFINVNLAIINLMPIPVLDGGHVLFSLWELVVRRPVPEKVAAGLVNVFLVLILGMLLFLSVRDVIRFTPLNERLRERREREAATNDAAEEQEEAAAPAAAPEAAPAPAEAEIPVSTAPEP